MMEPAILKPDGSVRGNGYKLNHRKLHLKMRKNFFIVGVTESCNRLPREVVESPSLEIHKSCVDTILNKVILLEQGGSTR